MPVRFRTVVVHGRTYSHYRVGTDGSVWTDIVKNRPRGGRYSVKRMERWGEAPIQTGEWRPLKSSPDGRGYLIVTLYSDTLSRKSFMVHTLVLHSFRGSPKPGQQCRHMNGKSGDNRLPNLRWGTSAQNAKDRIRHGTVARGERQGPAKLTADQVREIRHLASQGMVRRELSRRFNVTDVTLYRIIHRLGWINV